MKVPLLEYLDRLEATAKAVSQGHWSAPHGGWPSSRFGEVVSNEQPATEGYDGRLIAESCDRLVAPHIVATQPRATLALIAKLREAVGLIGLSRRVIASLDLADVLPKLEQELREFSEGEIEVPE